MYFRLIQFADTFPSLNIKCLSTCRTGDVRRFGTADIRVPSNYPFPIQVLICSMGKFQLQLFRGVQESSYITFLDLTNI